jgi:hypothetical protein
MPSRSSKSSKSGKNMMKGGTVSMEAQRAQMDRAFDPNANGGSHSNSLYPSKYGGAKKSSCSKKGGYKKGNTAKKYGGFGLEMVVPAFLLAANQLYKPRGKSVSFRKSRKNRTMRRR